MTPLQLSVKLIQRRDDLKLILGNKYDTDMPRAIILGVAKEDNIRLGDAALKVARHMSKAGHDPSLVFAAFVDECESPHIS